MTGTALTNFPNGFVGGITLFGSPTILPGNGLPTSSKYLFVNSVTGATGNPGTYELPLNSVDRAMDFVVADSNWIIVCQPGHTETLTAAGAVAMDVAGVTVVGLGVGNDRPRFTFSTATSASWLVTAANCAVYNVIGVAGIDGLTNPFHIQAAGFNFNIEWQDGSSAIEALRAILTTAAADKLVGNLTYRGFTAGDAVVNAVRLVGCNDARLNVDFYGILTTAVVQFITTACSDVQVTGQMYVSGTTDFSKSVVDTVTGSTWWASFFDGAAGVSVSGGSGSPLASNSVGSGAAVATADSTANTYARDVIGNKTDAAVYVPGTTNSIEAYAKGTASLQEKVALKTAATLTNGQTLFTVAGGPIEVVALVSICATGNDATASTLQYSATPTSGSAQTISGASTSLANAAAGASVTLAGTALATAALYNANGPNLIANPGTIMVPAGTITAVVGVGSTTGTWAHYIRYRPLAVGVTVS